MTHFNQFDRSQSTRSQNTGGQNTGISFSSGLLKPLTMCADLFAAGGVARAATSRVSVPAPFAPRRPAGPLEVRGYTPEGFTVFW